MRRFDNGNPAQARPKQASMLGVEQATALGVSSAHRSLYFIKTPSRVTQKGVVIGTI